MTIMTKSFYDLKILICLSVICRSLCERFIEKDVIIYYIV